MEKAIVELVGLEKFKPDFERTFSFFSRYQKFFRKKILVTVGGTNGKGETCYFLESLLLKENLRVALYTSPHILNFTERIRINGQDASVESLEEGFSLLRKNSHLSYFEFLLALFCERIQRESVLDIIILEVGLGGRRDCVNVFDPDLTAITGISRDHTAILGNTHKSILQEKFGIARENAPMVTTLESSYVRGLAKELAEKIKVFHVDLFGLGVLSQEDNFRMRNQLLASVLKEYLLSKSFPKKNSMLLLKRNLNVQSFSMFGRFQEVTIEGKHFIFIGAHNIDGVRKLCHYASKNYCERAKTMDLLMAFSVRPIKEVECFLKILSSSRCFFDRAYISSFDHPKALGKEKTLDSLKTLNIFDYVESWENFLESHDKSKTLMVLGSLYFIACMFKALH